MVYLAAPPPKRKVAPAPINVRGSGGQSKVSSFRKSFSQRRKRSLAERKCGYGDIDDWNALPEEDQARIRGHSLKLLKAFRNTKWFLQLLGSFPFKSIKLEDGSTTFGVSRVGYILFLVTTIIIASIFFMFTIGYISIFLVSQSGRVFHDRCGNTWGKTVLSRNTPAIVFVWSQLMVTTAGSVYVLIYGHNFLQFFNCVNEAVMQLDVDPTTGMFRSDIQGFIVFITLFISFIALFVTKSLHSLDELTGFVGEGIAASFFQRDLFLTGSSTNFTAKAYEELLPKCQRECRGCYESEPNNVQLCESNSCYNVMNRPAKDFVVIKYIGMVIIGYSLLGARALIRQFEFFCQVLVNLATVWNKRFMNYASNDNSINMDDPYRRRITNQQMLKDHYEIVKLYNETEENFSFILFVYYASVFFNLICQFYYIALLGTQVTCATAVQREREAAFRGACYDNATRNVNNTKDVLESGLVGRTSKGEIWQYIASFEDACSIKQESIIRHSSMTTVILLIVTLSSFVITTLDADRASHQADIGFYRVRKRGYLTCRTKVERNAMHSLVFSFTGPKPFGITAAGYFPIRKKTIIVLISVAFIYFLIIMGFKPGMVKSYVRCFEVTPEGVIKYVVQYPKVI